MPALLEVLPDQRHTSSTLRGRHRRARSRFEPVGFQVVCWAVLRASAGGSVHVIRPSRERKLSRAHNIRLESAMHHHSPASVCFHPTWEGRQGGRSRFHHSPGPGRGQCAFIHLLMWGQGCWSKFHGHVPVSGVLLTSGRASAHATPLTAI